MINIEQRALSTFKQQILSGLVGRVQGGRNVNDHRLDEFGIGHRLRKHSFVIDRLCTKIFGQDEIVIVEVFFELFCKALGIEEIVDPQCAPSDLVFIRWPDALAGGPDPGISALGRFASAIKRRMIGENERTTRADLETRTHLDTTRFKLFDFREQMVNVEHDTVTDVAVDTFVNNARGHQIELVDLLADNQRMTSIVATLKTDDALGVIG